MLSSSGGHKIIFLIFVYGTDSKSKCPDYQYGELSGQPRYNVTDSAKEVNGLKIVFAYILLDFCKREEFSNHKLYKILHIYTAFSDCHLQSTD
jgi:hypothetical protein